MSAQQLYAMHGRARGFGALDLQLNKTQFNIGETPNYTIIGASPNANVLWSSTRNGLPTGEQASSYGQSTDAQGTFSNAGTPWVLEQIGAWTKTATVGAESDTVAFNVNPSGSATDAPVTTQYIPIYTQAPIKPASNDTIDVFGYQISKPIFYVGAAVLAYLLFKKR